MSYDQRLLINRFKKIETLEECPIGVDLLVWDGCDFWITHCDVNVDIGAIYDTNAPRTELPFIAFFELPEQSMAELYLGKGEV